MTALSLGRRFVVVYAALWVVLDVVVLLPGNPDFSSGWGFVGAVVIQALIVWRLWHESAVAWAVAFLVAASTPLTVFLMGGPAEVGVVLLVIVSVAQAVTIAAPRRANPPGTSRSRG